MGFAVTHVLARILDREGMLAMATSAQSAATFLAVARLVKEIGTAVNIIINKLCILENMTSFFENINVASIHRYWEGKGIGPPKRSWVSFHATAVKEGFFHFSNSINYRNLFQNHINLMIL